MYFTTRENRGHIRRPFFGAAPAIAAGGVVITVGMVLEALALLLAAIAAAYLLMKALEKARSLGIGVDWATQKLLIAMATVVGEAKGVITKVGRLLVEARRRRLPPNCEPLLVRLREWLMRIVETLRQYEENPINIRPPQLPAVERLLSELRRGVDEIRPVIRELEACLRG